MVNVLGHVVHRIRRPGGRHLRTFTSLSAAGLVEAIVSSLSVIVLVRLAGAGSAGQVIFAQSVATVSLLLCDPRLENAAQRFVPLEQRRTGQGSTLFLRLFRWDVAIGLAATGAGLAAVLAARSAGLVTGELALMLALAIAARGAMAPHGTAGAAFALVDRLRAYGSLRVRCAILSFGLSSGGLLAGGPVVYLVGQVVGALITAVVFAVFGIRALFTELGPARGRVPLPAGLVAFTVKASSGTSVAELADSGVLTVAGVLGGPTLVTIIKIASAPGRLYGALTMPVASMLYPRLAQAVAEGGQGTLIRRDIARATRVLAVTGTVTLVVALPFTDDALRLVYGPEYTALAAVAMVLTAAACVKALVCWSNALALAVGQAGWRLGYLSAEVVLLLGTLLLACRVVPGAGGASLSFAWGTLALAVLGAGVWIASARRIIGGAR
ncbi:hypothetical protein [Streptosporangium sp. LJ11]|uniref:hypothetical protein n=1 Tax=Streptosporangium sp. LJ11 TaxID=3436927 RepID=UPI003F79D7E9